MRYRISDYQIPRAPSNLQDNYVFVLPMPENVYNELEEDEESSTLTADSQRRVIESIRLIADETQGGYVICSTGQKVGVFTRITKADGKVSLLTNKTILTELANGDEDDIAAIQAMNHSDMFTIEMDWGDEPGAGGGGEEETISVDIVCDGYYTEPDPDYTYREIVPIGEVARPKTHLKIVNKTAAPSISGGYNVLVDGKLFYDTPQSYGDKYDAGAVLVDEDIYGKEIAFVHYTAAQQHPSHTLTADVTYSIEGGIYGAKQAILNAVSDIDTTSQITSTILKEQIMGGKLPYDCGESVPAFISEGDLADCNDMNEDGELFAYSVMQRPDTVVVGDVFTAGSFKEQTEGMFFLVKAVDNPSLHYDGQDFSVSGITEKLEVQAGKSYIVTGVYELNYHGEEYGVETSGLLITYDEYEHGRSVREVYKKLDNVAKETTLQEMDAKLGNVVMAAEAEYADFKSHMETEIENILTPIEEEGE